MERRIDGWRCVCVGEREREMGRREMEEKRKFGVVKLVTDGGGPQWDLVVE